MAIHHLSQFDSDTLLDSLNDGVVKIGLDKRVKYLNRAAEDLLGYTLEEAREMSCASVVRCMACENNCLLDQTLASGRNITHFKTVLTNRLGRVIPVSSNAILLRDAAGRVTGGIEIIRNRVRNPGFPERSEENYAFEGMIGKSDPMQDIFARLPVIAQTDSGVLIQGGPGSGKDRLALAIHRRSARALGPFQKVSCEGLSDRYLESELFGHIRGAFAGALSDKIGRFEEADGGTLYLDEIGKLGSPVQSRLITALRTGRVERVGENRKRDVNVRVIASTRSDLREAVDSGDFRSDLLDQLAATSVILPPLRNRREDLTLLIPYFLNKSALEVGKKPPTIAPKALEVLLNYDFPGNVRELENIIAHATVICQEETLQPGHLPKDLFRINAEFLDRAIRRDNPIKTVERQLVLRTLTNAGWNYKKAAEQLKISRTTLWRKMREFEIRRPSPKPTSHHT